MANSVMKDLQGPDWPLGFISVVTPGTPVGIMSLVDPTSANAPETASIAAGLQQTTTGQTEYSVTAYAILFQPCRLGASHGFAQATGNVYIVRKGAAGSGNRDDPGVVIATLAATASTAIPLPFVLTSAARNRDSFSPYRYYADADNAGDGVLVTLIIQ